MELKNPWEESIDGMHVLYGNLEDQYRISYKPDIVYAEKDGTKLHLQMLVMRDPIKTKKYPLILYITGSGWQTQERFDRLPQLVDFAREGYLVASMEYRNTDNGFQFPSQIEDAESAVLFLKKHAEDYQIDTERIAIWGDSSGAHTAVMTALIDNQELGLKCVVDFFGPVDFNILNDWPTTFKTCLGSWGKGEPINLFFGGDKSKNDEILKQASPLTYISKGKKIPPFLIIHGDHDNTVHIHHSIELYQKLKENCYQAEFYVVRNAAHGYQFWTSEILSVVKRFFNAYL